ncbi:MAG: transposase [Nitrospirota bacterium]
MNLRERISWIKTKIQADLFPHLKECFPDQITQKQKQLITILEIVEVERHVKLPEYQWMGRKLKDRYAIGRAFVAKAVYNLGTTRALIEALHTMPNLRRICGFDGSSFTVTREGATVDGKLLSVVKKRGSFPSEATFSRAFCEFAESGLGERVHEALVREHLSEELIGHISRDSTAIEGNERPAEKFPKKSGTWDNKEERKKRGRPRKGEVRVERKEETRLNVQINQTPAEALKDIPMMCDVGCKTNAKGYKETWIGYKLHADTNDSGLPITAVLTSASLHDSQVAIPMMKITTERVTYLYDLMDAAYDAKPIYEVSKALGHVPIIDRNPRRGESVPMSPAEALRYNERTVAERFNARLKDEFGGRSVMVRGAKKVRMHLMFGVIALFADQLLKLLT